MGEALNAEGMRVLGVAIKELRSMDNALAAAAAAAAAGSSSSRSTCGELDDYEAACASAATPDQPSLGTWAAGTLSSGSPSSPQADWQRQQQHHLQSESISATDASTKAFQLLGTSSSCSTSGTPAPPAKTQELTTAAEEAMTFVGFLAFLDPPRESAVQAVRELYVKAVGIKVWNMRYFSL